MRFDGNMNPGVGKILLALLLAFLLATALTEIYRLTAMLSELSLWESAALVHTALSLIVLAGWRRWRLPKRESLTLGKYSLPVSCAFLPGIAVLIGAFFVSALTSRHYDLTVWTPEVALMVLWVPLVEELVFRVGLGGFFRRGLGVVLGGYVSALLFALVHGLPGFAELFRGNLGLPLGPLLLGLANEALYVKSGRIAPIFFLHAACNGTAVVFRTFDPRWLDWLSWFYL